MNNGLGRNLRRNKALSPGYISLDERTIQDMVTFTLTYSKRLNYYNVKNEVSGDWESFYLNDPSFIMAIISGTDINEFKIKNDAIRKRQSQKDEYVQNVSSSLKNIFRMGQSILHWFDLLTKSNYKGSLLDEIKHLKSSLLDDVVSLKYSVSFVATHGYNNASIIATYEEFGEVFKLSKEEKKIDNEVMNTSSEQYLHELNEIFHLIYGKMIFMKESATQDFYKKLEGIHNHHPHIGLLLAFFKLFQLVQNDINTFTKKHLDYYYKNLLEERVEPKTRRPNSALLGIKLKNGVDKLILEKNALFEFGNEGKSEDIFHNTDTTQINRATISDIKSIYKSYHTPFTTKYEIDAFHLNLLFETDVLKRIKENEETPPEGFKSFPNIFGGESHSKSDIGFLISSPALILEEGIQEIELTFKFEKSSVQKMRGLFLKLNKAERSNRDEHKLKKERSLENVMQKFFRQAFKIFISDKVGWKQISYSVPDLKNNSSILKISIPLKALDDQLIAPDPEIHEGEFSVEWPCIKLLLNSNATYHPYVFIKDLALEYIQIKATITEVESLLLSNTNGEIDNSIPFTPFGAIPEKGSYLRIKNPKILQKNLSSLQLFINWNGLPQLKNGFKKYYENYDFNIDNGDFRASLSKDRELLRNSNVNKQQVIKLFNTDGEGYLKNETQVDVSLEELNFNDATQEKNGKIANNASALYLILKNPMIGFGHRVFPEIYARAAMKMSKFRRRPKPLPKQPYTPIIDHLKVNYCNIAKENVTRKLDESNSDIILIHLYPFGHVTAFPGPIKSQCFLFPQIKSKGNLNIGLQHVVSGDNLSIGFDLIAAVYAHTVLKVPIVSWSYLDNNVWKDLTDHILDDETNGLLKSGILKLKIPNSISFNNTRLSKGRFWIKAKCDGIEDLNSRVKNIFTQAIAVNSNEEFTEIGSSGLAKYKLLGVSPIGIKNIEKVIGPMHFVIGSSKVSDHSYYSRVSERLRHKDRGVTNWELERIILEKFNQVQKIRVYGRNNYPNELVQGSTTQIVLIPKNHSVVETLTQGNKLDVSTLRQVKEYIMQFVSPYTKIEVCNPVYEQLKVRCRIQFIDLSKSRLLRDKLNRELIQFLSPDLENKAIDRQFDEAISKTQIFNFIEQKRYVDFIEEFSVIQLVSVTEKHKIIDTEKPKKNKRNEELRTISAYAILTSAPKHHIDIITPDSRESGKIKGIGDIEIGSDFVMIDANGIYIEN